MTRSKGEPYSGENLILTCEFCNLVKGSWSVDEFAPLGVENLFLKTPSLHDTTPVNGTCASLWILLTLFSLPGKRGQIDIHKTHAMDTACTGKATLIESRQVLTQQVTCVGRGSYQRNGFPTGNQVIVIVAKGKKARQHFRRVRVVARASGSFNIQAIRWKNCRLVQRANSYRYLGFLSSSKDFKNSNKKEEQRFLLALKGWISAPSIG